MVQQSCDRQGGGTGWVLREGSKRVTGEITKLVARKAPHCLFKVPSRISPPPTLDKTDPGKRIWSHVRLAQQDEVYLKPSSSPIWNFQLVGWSTLAGFSQGTDAWGSTAVDWRSMADGQSQTWSSIGSSLCHRVKLLFFVGGAAPMMNSESASVGRDHQTMMQDPVNASTTTVIEKGDPYTEKSGTRGSKAVLNASVLTQGC
ncbi:hypothetical protein BO79DRAFT_233054 [Aspergillus costaricaensis CBS 115574]|uniref:Uncharacterized protein n=1 Tax=Aspergillus costaricaensis CBS 115574 TaxID=1448317 RepID=A0ACD1I1L2_9EURO|nr:hypothetical protein BO79DRAFT_233054 [Aspergillus costaricaensis CBS 115574]RAK83648.1 hypothetical protein BO79DRAFT_233054 [Aspergillus costaricaensis CBS 115574]